MKVSDLPEKYKIYKITVTDKSEYYVNGEVRKNILNATGPLVELPEGNVFNKACMVSCNLDHVQSAEYFRSLPKEIVDSIVQEVELKKLNK
jgi:hypothetical protein